MSQRHGFRGLACVVMLACGCTWEPVPDPCRYRVCNIDEPECIEQVSQAVACNLGEVEVIVPTVRFVTSDELVAEIEAEHEQPTPEQVRDITDYYLGEALVGLMPDTYEYEPPALNVTEWAAAFYSIGDDEIVVITDNFDSDDATASYTLLVHEMIHVYQARDRDLEALSESFATSFDRFLGLRAAIEGEAEVYRALAEIELAGLHPARVDWSGFFAEYRANVLAAAAAADEPSQQAVGLFPYPYGVEFMYGAQQDDSFAGIDAVFESPPVSVRQVVGGYDAWPTNMQNRDDLLDVHAAPVLPDRYTYLGGGHQSVWLLNTMLQRTAGHTGPWASWELEVVSADYLSVYRDEQSSEIVAIWRIQTDVPDIFPGALLVSDSSWIDAASAVPSTHVFTMIDDDIVLVATTGADALLVLAEISGWQSLHALQTDTPVTRMRRSMRREFLATRP